MSKTDKQIIELFHSVMTMAAFHIAAEDRDKWAEFHNKFEKDLFKILKGGNN